MRQGENTQFGVRFSDGTVRSLPGIKSRQQAIRHINKWYPSGTLVARTIAVSSWHSTTPYQERNTK